MKQFGHYQIIAELGRGGMGVVLKAHEQSLNRYVAIKVLSQQLADDESVRERFIREARAVAALNHPNVVQVYFAGEHDGQPFFSMEFVQGQALNEYLKQHAPLAPREAAEILLQAARGLAAAHDKGIVHRDIKPANLMMDEGGVIKLTDFGIAMAEDQGKKLTSTGEFVGTPGYLSPEVCIGSEVDARTDIFSLGIVYYEMLAGTPPFTNPSPLGLMREVVEAQIPDIARINGEVDELTRSLLTRMLQKKPEDRFETCHPLIEALEVGLQQNRFSATRPLPNRDATRIWAEETTDATRVGAATPPPAPPAEGEPQRTEPAAPPPPSGGPPGPHNAATAVSRKRGNRSAAIWLAAALLLLMGAAIAAVSVFPRLLPEPVQRLMATLGGFTQLAENKAESVLESRISKKPSEKVKVEADDVGDAGNIIVQSEAATSKTIGKEPPPEDKGRIPSVELVVPTSEVSRAETVATRPDAGQKARPRAQKPQMNALDKARQASLTRLASGHAKAAILLVGEAAVLDALQTPLSELLQEQGVELVDNSLLGGAGPWLRNDHWDLKGLQKKALLEGIDLLVLVSSRYLGQETLNYYGQSSELISSNVELKVVRVPDLSLVVQGKRFQVRYTTLNADYQVREAFADVAPELEHRLSQSLNRGG